MPISAARAATRYLAILCIASGPQAEPVVAHINSMGRSKAVQWITEPAAPKVDVVDVGDARKGLVFAQKICSACHNVLRTEAASPNKQAPPFKAIANTPGMSITALTVWSRTSHPTMPNLVIDPNDMDDLIAYILALRDRK